MWELVSGEPPFKTLRHAEVMRTVVVDNARPKFAFGTPREYVALAENCWDRDPNIRYDKVSKIRSFHQEHDLSQQREGVCFALP